MEIEKKDLLSFYISADPSLKAKTKKAIADWVVKFLYKEEKMTKGELIKAFSRHLSAKVKDDPQFDKAIEHLIGNNVITPQGEYFCLTKEYRSKVIPKVNDVASLHEYVFLSYFRKADLNKEIVHSWFQDVTIGIFEKYFFDLYSDHFHAENIQDNYHREIEKIIDETSSHLSATKETKEYLKSQYFNFLKAEDNKSAQLFLHYGMANFSAMLFASNHFVNRISLDIFENITLLLDTNVLLVLRTKESDCFEALPLMESIFKIHNVRLEYLQETVGEYDRSIKNNHDCMRAIVKSGSHRSILQPMMQRNVFLRAIIERGYTTLEEVDVMFENQKSLPEVFYQDIPIALNEKIKNDNQDYLREIERMSAAITSFQQKLGTVAKTGNRLTHDASLLAATNILRLRGEKYAILTNDYVLQEYAKEDVKNDNIPTALSFSAVVTMLEYFQSDPTNHASNIAPVFKRMLTSEMLSLPEDIAPQDISRVYKYNRDIKMLDDASFDELIHKVKESQLNNDSNDDIADMISTFIDSRIQKSNDEDFASRQKIRDLERKNEDYKSKQKTTDNILKESIRGNIISDRKIECMMSWGKLIGIIIGVIIVNLAVKAYPYLQSIDKIYTDIFTAIGGLGLMWKFVDFKHLTKKWVYNKVEIKKELDVRISELNNN